MPSRGSASGRADPLDSKRPLPPFARSWRYIPPRAPLDWATTQHNLAVVYRALFEKDREPGHLDDAIEAIDGALEEFRAANKSRLIETTGALREKILAAKGAL